MYVEQLLSNHKTDCNVMIDMFLLKMILEHMKTIGNFLLVINTEIFNSVTSKNNLLKAYEGWDISNEYVNIGTHWVVISVKNNIFQKKILVI